MLRSYWKVTICAVVFTILAGQVPLRAAAPESPAFSVPVPLAEELVKRIKPIHPRLLLDHAGFDGLRKENRRRSVLQKWDADL